MRSEKFMREAHTEGEAGVISTHRMTPVQFDTLAWLVEQERATGTVPTQVQTAAHFGVGKVSMNWRWARLIEAGCIATTLGQSTTVLDAGRAIVAAGKDAATARRCALPEGGGPLPAEVHLDAGSVPLIAAVYQAAKDGRALMYAEVAAVTGRTLRAVQTQVRTLRRHQIFAEGTRRRSCDGGHIQLTWLGLGVADGRVSVLPPNRSGRPPGTAQLALDFADGSPPIKVGVTASGLALLRILRTENLAGRKPSLADLGRLAGKSGSAAGTQISALRHRKLVEPDAHRLTPLGIEVAEGRVGIERPQKLPSVARRSPAPPPSKPALALCRSAAPPPPTTAPRPLRTMGTPALPHPELPSLPAPIATLRGIKHPPLPQAHAAPPGMREATWVAITTVRSPMASGWS